MSRKNLIIYIGILFVIQTLSIFVQYELVPLYISISIFIIGFMAMFWQKKIDGKPIKEMGFRINRNALIGIIIGLLYIFLVILFIWVIPTQLGWINIIENVNSPTKDININNAGYIILIFLTDGVLMFIAALLGEELAFRGYIQPKLESLFGKTRGIIISAVIFALWHIPVYFSLYRGGAADLGGLILAIAIYQSFISVISLSILYTTTKELYGVSMMHAVFDMIVYYVIGSSLLGEASSFSLFTLNVLNPHVYELYVQIIQFLFIVIMIFMCRIARKYVIVYDPQSSIFAKRKNPDNSHQKNMKENGNFSK